MRATPKTIALAGLLTIATAWGLAPTPARAGGRGVQARGAGGRPGFKDPRFRPGFPRHGYIAPGFGWYRPGFPVYPYYPPKCWCGGFAGHRGHHHHHHRDFGRPGVK